MLFIAGLIEGVFRQTVTSVAIRFTVAGATAAWWIYYFGFVGRRRDQLEAAERDEGRAMTRLSVGALLRVDDPKLVREIVTPEGIPLRFTLARAGDSRGGVPARHAAADRARGRGHVGPVGSRSAVKARGSPLWSSSSRSCCSTSTSRCSRSAGRGRRRASDRSGSA